MTRVELVRRYWSEVWSQGDTSMLSEFYAPTYRENEQQLTPPEFAGHVTRWRGKFDGFRAEVERVWETSDAVISRVVYSGTHTGDLTLLPASGRSFRCSGLDVFEFVDDRVVQHWHETDHLELFEQLGAAIRAGD